MDIDFTKTNEMQKSIDKADEFLRLFPNGLENKLYYFENADWLINELRQIFNGICIPEERIRFIESEFFGNMQNLSDHDSLLNIYQNKWRNHLPSVPNHGWFEQSLNDISHPLHDLMRELTNRGILDFETKLMILGLFDIVADDVRLIVNGIKDLLKIKTNEVTEDEAEADSQTKRTMRVTTDALMKILIKAGLPAGKVNNKDIADLISCITGFNRESIRQELSNTSKLPYRSREEVEKINTLLGTLKFKISLTYDEENRNSKD